mgnify:CR=1 FL=1
MKNDFRGELTGGEDLEKLSPFPPELYGRRAHIMMELNKILVTNISIGCSNPMKGGWKDDQNT